MNTLAEEQKKLCDLNTTQEELDLQYIEFLKLYYKYREKEERKWYSKLTLEQRKKIHKLILSIYKLKNRLGGFSYEILNDLRKQTDRPIIFAVTHIGKFDIEIVSEAIKEHYYLLSGDYEHLQGTIDSKFLRLNGVFYFNENVKIERKKVTQDMIEHLHENGNIMYFAEGTWNITPNLPVLPCYWGIVDIAKKGNAIIVPIAVEQYNKHFKINIDKNFDMLKYEDNVKGKIEAIGDLRDTLATLKWDIWETIKVSRKDIDENEWKKYIEERFQEWPYFNEDYIANLIYKPKNEFAHDEVYEHLRKLTPSKDNAFLFNKRLL